MLRLPRHLLGSDQRQTVLLHGITFIIVIFVVQAGIGIRLWRILDKLRDIKSSITHVIVRRQLVPIEYRQLDLERRLVSPNMKEELLFPGRIQRMPDDARAKHLFAE